MTAGNPTVIFKAPGSVAIETKHMPEAEEGAVLIRTKKSLISTGTELTILSGRFPKESAWSRYGVFPFIPGYDNVGEVIDVGKGVDSTFVGKRVASHGPHAMYVTAHAEELREISDGVADDEAVFFAIAEIVLNGVRRSNVRLGESVVVYGAGLLGQFTARFCRICGASPVAVVDISDRRLEMLPRDSRIVKINPNVLEVEKGVREITKGRMADVVFEVTGDPAVIPSEFRSLRRQGRFVVLSSPRGPTLFDFHDLCNSPSFTIIGTHNSSHPPYESWDNPWTMRRHSELFFDLILSGELDVASLITHRSSYLKAAEFYAMLLDDRTQAMGVVFDWI